MTLLLTFFQSSVLGALMILSGAWAIVTFFAACEKSRERKNKTFIGDRDVRYWGKN